MNQSFPVSISLSEPVTLPSWAELPDFGLYMDQVLSLTCAYLPSSPDGEERPLTSSMVNNYVKLRILPPATGKKYSRGHIAFLIMICLLKPILPMTSIRTLFTRMKETCSEEEIYTSFRETFHTASADALATQQQSAATADRAVLYAALRAGSERRLALGMLLEEDA